MFETVFGIPAHPLIIHVPVVLLPMLIAATLVYGLVPAWRGRVDWAVVLLAVITPVSCYVARLSGQALRARLVHRQEVSAPDLTSIDVHQNYSTYVLYLAIALGVVALVLVAATKLRVRGGTSGFGLVPAVVLVLAVGLSGVVGYYLFKTGDTGAHIVWNGR